MRYRTALAQLGLFNARLPRYRSYPTVKDFTTDFAAPQIAAWLSTLPVGRTVSLNLHVPFCRQLCWFCASRTQTVREENTVWRYVEAVEREAALIAAQLPPATRVGAIHITGGTLSVLPADLLTRLLRALRSVAKPVPNISIKVDIDAADIDADRLWALAAGGMTEARIAIQDFSPEIQAMIGRMQRFDRTASTVRALWATGIDHLEVDVCYGLPSQTPQHIAKTLQQVVAFEPSRIVLNGYTHTPWLARRQFLIPGDLLPDARARLNLFETARRFLLWDGYVPVGTDTFTLANDPLVIAAARGELRRDINGYTTQPRGIHIGLGAEGLWRLPQGLGQNHANTAVYEHAINQGRLAVSRGHALTDEDRLRGRAIEMILCDLALNREKLLAEWPDQAPMLDRLIADVTARFDTALIIDAQGFSLRPDARPAARLIAAQFDTNLPQTLAPRLSTKEKRQAE